MFLLALWYFTVCTGAALSSWAFLVRYHLKSRGAWRYSLTGVSLMTMGASCGLVFTYLDIALGLRVLGMDTNYPGRMYIGPVLLTLLAAAITLVWLAFERSQKET